MSNALPLNAPPKGSFTARLWMAAAFLFTATWLVAAPPHHGVLVHLQSSSVSSFEANHNVTATRLNANRDLYLVKGHGKRSDEQLLDEIKSDPAAGNPEPNPTITFGAGSQLDGQSTASVLNGQSTASVLNGQSTASVLNGQSTASVLNGQSTASVLNGKVWYYTSRAPDAYVNQPTVGQIQSGASAHALATGDGVVVGLVDNGVDPRNPVLRGSILWSEGFNFYDGTSNTSAYADINCQAIAGALDGQSTASVLNGQSTASVLNGQSTASVLNGHFMAFELRGQSTASVLNGQSTASVLNGQSTASVLNALGCLNGQSTASVLNGQSTASVLNGQSTASVLNSGDSTVLLLDGQSTASVLNGQSTASVLNSVGCPLSASELAGQSTASVLNGQSTASVLNGQSTASVLNGQSTASVLNGQSTASVLNALAQIVACYPDFGHGTSVAGLIHLVAPETKILPITAFGPDGTADAATIYQSIAYAIDHHVNVLNLSFSGTDTTGDIRDIIQEAVNDGIIVSAAAGNGATSDAVYPASLAGVIGVGALDGTAANTTFPLADFSNFDPGPGQVVDDDVAAPGVDLLTTYPGGGLLWAIASGTSFSTPLVAGEGALLVQLQQTGAVNKGEVESSSNPSISGDANGETGHGLVNVTGALNLAPPPATPPDSGHNGHDNDHHRR